MGRELFKLSARKVTTTNKPGYYADGGGLYLQVTGTGAKSWVFRYRFGSKRPEMGLGPLHTISLAEARDAAQEARKALLAGTDPLAARRAARAANMVIPTFWDAATTYIDEQKAGWRNAKHADQWNTTLEKYAKPFIGGKRVDLIDTDDILAMLKPIWSTKTETATRVRQRAEAVIDSVFVKHSLAGKNPARWRGHLALLLPKRSAIAPQQHFPALPYTEVPKFIAELRARHGESARALEFLILTASRTMQTLEAPPAEFRGDLWVIPKERMKAKREHVVPLSAAAAALAGPRLGRKHLVFQHDVTQEVFSENALLALLKRMGYGHVTVHGFRSSFKDWCRETTDYPDDMSEMALAHHISDKTRAAYQRLTMVEKRRQLMEEWATYCLSHLPSA
ncbi:tyrosine-type recombinase/integrase [Pseudoxanthomonas winnipegensis]|uniref:DUF4102 domain-containing protein n=1 Tax=Pseudoxanthomonas winnipegensis TaxID=2480810 RepID=A0A4Q8M507_9GAMM|nr:integrase arm-type DNA-binding domain-containing protein [Pseudoxanthomonas winnipegensis]TAA42514.1 DUF4102 domain-containing protein [Pseudoxanthomonas winnipegensis]